MSVFYVEHMDVSKIKFAPNMGRSQLISRFHPEGQIASFILFICALVVCLDFEGSTQSEQQEQST